MFNIKTFVKFRNNHNYETKEEIIKREGHIYRRYFDAGEGR